METEKKVSENNFKGYKIRTYKVSGYGKPMYRTKLYKGGKEVETFGYFDSKESGIEKSKKRILKKSIGLGFYD